MRQIELEVVPVGPVANRFLDNTGSIVELIRGPVGSAKTSTAMTKLLKLAQMQAPNEDGIRPTRWAMVRRTYEDVEKTIYADWVGQWKALAPFRKTTKRPMHDEIKVALDDGTSIDAEFVFLALDRPEDIERIRGGNFTGFLFNEVKQVLMEHLTNAVARSGRYPSIPLAGVEVTEEIAMVLGDTNAPDDEHWLKEIEDTQPEGWSTFIQPPAAWPAEHAPAEYRDEPVVLSRSNTKYIVNPDAENIQNLRSNYYQNIIKTAKDDQIRADVCNIFTHIQEGKPVYPEYLDITHCNDAVKADKNLELLIGADGGLTPAVVFGQVSERGQLRIIEELQADDMSVFQFWRDVVKPHIALKYREFSIGFCFFDPSAGNRGEGEGMSSIGLLNDMYDRPETLDLGFIVEEAPTNDLTIRLDAVKHFLTKTIDGHPGFLMAPQCTILRRGFNGKYHYRKVQVKNTDRYTEKPEKGPESHLHDSLQYLCQGAMGGYVTPYVDPLERQLLEGLKPERNAVTGY